LMADKPQPVNEHHADQSNQQPASRNASGKVLTVGWLADIKKFNNCKHELKSNVQL